MSKVKTTYYKDGKPVKTVIEDYVPADFPITKTWVQQMKDKRERGKFKK